jgi:hypothetical protein
VIRSPLPHEVLGQLAVEPGPGDPRTGRQHQAARSRQRVCERTSQTGIARPPEQVAAYVNTDPDLVLDKAAANLDRLLIQHQGTMTEVWLMRWRERLSEGPSAVLKALTSEDPESVELRQNSPFAGLLSQPQRQKVSSPSPAAAGNMRHDSLSLFRGHL